MSTNTYHLRRLLKASELNNPSYEKLVETRNYLIDQKNKKENELSRIPKLMNDVGRAMKSLNAVDMGYENVALEDQQVEIKRFLLEKAIKRLDYYIRAFSDEAINQLIEEQKSTRVEVGRELYLNAMDYKGNNPEKAINEFRKSMVYGIKSAEKQLIELYSESDLDEHRSMIDHIKLRDMNANVKSV